MCVRARGRDGPLPSHLSPVDLDAFPVVVVEEEGAVRSDEGRGYKTRRRRRPSFLNCAGVVGT
jgi:hypothetical protein